jgi:glyoxylase-like metal-dependent hydrolase (beta-lactamase superfamily II)
VSASPPWRLTGPVEVADRVYVWRHPVLDVNATLVVGQGGAVLVDTLSTAAQAAELSDAVRAVTRAPLVLVNTHHHFDHCFGNATLAGRDTPVWAHEEAAAQLREHGARWQREWYLEWLDSEPDLARGLAEVTIRPPDHEVTGSATVSAGDRPVHLRHLGRGHTAGDLVVEIPDADCVLAGDLVEQGAPPSFGDSFPVEWPETVAALHRRLGPGTVVVPGHGSPVDAAFVAAQHAELTALAWLIRDGHGDGAPADAVAAKAGYDRATALTAVRRGYAELAGRD